MRKLITLLAVATLVASSFAQAETTQPTNPNDPLQQIQPNGSETPTTLADADTSTNAASTDQTTTTTTKTVTKHHKKKHHCNCKGHHCKTHHHKKAAAETAPASEEPAATPSTQ